MSPTNIHFHYGCFKLVITISGGDEYDYHDEGQSLLGLAEL